jgi:predicted enzyme related to lactoylglutathione lyase
MAQVKTWLCRQSRTYRESDNGGIGMKIKLTSVYVDDQDKALRFYTDVLGFTKKADFHNGPFRWLTVASPDEADGTELQLALNDNPAAKAYQQALFRQGQPAVMFFTDDVKGDYERVKARGAGFTMPPTAVTGSTIAQLNSPAATSFKSPNWRAGKGGPVELEQMDSSDPPLAVDCLYGDRHRQFRRHGNWPTSALGGLRAAPAARLAAALRSVHVRLALCGELARRAKRGETHISKRVIPVGDTPCCASADNAYVPRDRPARSRTCSEEHHAGSRPGRRTLRG